MSERTEDREPEPQPAEGEGEPEAAPASVEEERDLALAKWQRARADYQNLKRRTLTDVETAVRRARQPLLEGMLQVLDYLDMALQTKVESPEAKNVLLGVELTRGQLVQFLEQEDVQPIAEGGVFDPDVHEAVATIPSAEHEPGAIVDTVRRGYRWGDRVLRFAQVRVATEPDSGSDADAPEDAETQDAESH